MYILYYDLELIWFPLPAAQNDDYAEPVGLLKIPAGSIKGAKHCIEVGVIT